MHQVNLIIIPVLLFSLTGCFVLRPESTADYHHLNRTVWARDDGQGGRHARETESELLVVLQSLENYKNYNKIIKEAKRALRDAKSARNRPDGMSIDEYAAVRLYTFTSLYRLLNQRLRDDEKLETIMPYKDFLVKSLAWADEYDGDVWRGTGEDIKTYSAGSSLEWKDFKSTSMNKATAERYAKKATGGDKILTRIINAHGYEIWPYAYEPNDKEVLLTPLITIKVLNVTKPIPGQTEYYFCVLQSGSAKLADPKITGSAAKLADLKISSLILSVVIILAV